MRKTICKCLMATAMLLSSQGMWAQDCNIPMSAIVDEGFANVTTESASALQTQLERLITQSKLDVGWKNANFAITAKFDQLDRYIVSSAPTQIANVFGVTLYLVDVYNQKLFASAYVEVKGVGANDTKASMNAIRQLNAGNGKINTFLSGAKRKIIGYYDSQLPSLIKDARTKASFKNYEEALAMLAVVPTCCNGYDTAMKEAMRIYVLYRDTYFLARLNEAKALWAANPTQTGSIPVVAILSSVDPDAKCYKDAMALLAQVAKVVKTDVDYETKKKYEDAVELEKLRIQAIGEIGKAYAANRPMNIMFLGHSGAIATQSPINIQ